MPELRHLPVVDAPEAMRPAVGELVADAVAVAAVQGSGAFELRVLETVLNALDVLVYVSDMQTHELLFVSATASMSGVHRVDGAASSTCRRSRAHPARSAPTTG